MALRPFSLLLLLLLVMIPAQAFWSYNFFDECEQPDRICVFVDNKFRETSADLALIKWWSPTPSYAFDGVVVDKSDGKKWVVKNKVLLESRVHIRDGCEVKFWSALIPEMNEECTKYENRKETVKNGMRFVPFSYDSDSKILIYEMVVEAGREPYVADYMELYIREPTVRFGLYKYDNGPKMSQYSPALIAFTCGPLTEEAPDPRASKSAPEGTTAELRNKYTCPGGTLMFIGGTNIGLQEGYCSQGGWRKTDRKLIFEQEHGKRTPYCWKETIFTECSKNRCYFFNNPDAPTEVTTDQSRAPAQLGVYVEYDTDDKWYVQIATKRNEPKARVLSFTIGNEEYVINSNTAYQSRIDGKKVSATLVRYDSGAVTGTTLYKFKLEANAGEADKDLMTAFGFYTDAPNKIALSLAVKFDLGEVANYKKYASTTDFVFKGAGAYLLGNPNDKDNVFKCDGKKNIYLDDFPTGANKIRFTAKGWLFMDGRIASAPKKDANGKDVVEVVNCFSVCLESSITLAGEKGKKPIKNPTKFEYTCGNDNVKVNGKLYSTVVCEEYWKGDNEKIILTEDFKLTAECQGAFKYAKQVCSPTEENGGCGKVTRDSKGALTCDTGFVLTIEGSADPNAIYGSLRVDQNENWVDGNTVHFKTEDAHKAVCYSKCKPDNVDTTVPSSVADETPAIYKYDPKTKTGALTCTGTNVLTANVEARKKSYNTLTCGSKGWNLAGKGMQDFPAAKSVTDLVVKAQCLKACDEIKINKNCNTPTTIDALFGCQTPAYSMQTLSCPETHVLIVNDEISDEKLVCSNKGWAKAQDGSLFIDFSKYDLPPQINAHCFDKCGSKFVTVSGDATLSLSPSKLACPETKMISYTVESEPAIDTLNDMTCKQDGWTDGARLIHFDIGKAKKITAVCKPSCIDTLIKQDCSGHYHCVKAEFKETDLSWSCGPGHVLWAAEQKKSSPTPLTCEKNSIKSANMRIERTSPTSQATVSCYSICDATFFPLPEPGLIEKLDQNDGGFTMQCKNDLHFIGITYAVENSEASGETVTEYFSKFKCTTDQPAAFLATHTGREATVACKDKCKDRIKSGAQICNNTNIENDAPECVREESNKITCGPSYVLRIVTDTKPRHIFGNTLECKKDGFYENTEKVLSFADDPNADAKLQFEISCISLCDRELALLGRSQLSPARMGDVKRKGDGDVIQCENEDPQTSVPTLANDKILHITYGAAKYRVFGPATCDNSSGWTGENAKEDPPGTADGHIVKFADNKAILNAKCVEVCKGVKNADTSSCEPLGLCKTAKHDGNNLSCDSNYRLVLNGTNSDGIAGVTTTNSMTCSKEGWMEASQKIVDFKDPIVDITKPVEAVCKNKCHPDFITFTNEEACPKDTECSKPIYDPSSKTLKCSDTTEVLVIEHNGELKESFPTTPTDTSSGTPEAKCDNSGWTANGQKLFDMSASDYLNFHVKARCEQLCRFNLDHSSLNAEPKVLVYDSKNKTLTCNGIDKMLALNGVGVYSDLTCSKDGWKTDKPEAKVTFAPIMAPVGNDATKNQKDERAKKFTCIPNDCMRPLPCKETDNEKDKCMNPDFEKKKYMMSCESPSKLAPKDGTKNTISYDYLRCIGGEWKDSTGVTAIDITNPPMICNADACTGCNQDDLKAIESSTDANLKPINWNEGSYITCSFYKCGTGLHYAVQDPSEKFKYYHSKGEETIKCSKADTNSPSVFSSPDEKEIVRGKVGCVQQIPCNEYRPLKTDCEGCDSDAFQLKLKIGSIPSPDPVKCDTLGQMYYRKSDDKKGWKIVNELKCTKTGEWEINVQPENKPEIIPETMLSALPHIICSISDPNPQDEAPKNDRKTATCAYCPYPPVIDCKECKNAQDHATATNNGDGKCIMKIINGRFKFNGEEEIDKSAALVCQNVNGEYAWLTPDGKKVDTLAVIMNEMDNVSTGAIAGIVIGVILLLGLIVFGMVYVAIRKRRAKEQAERLKSKGLEQKIDSIIDHATIVDDTKTLVL